MGRQTDLYIYIYIELNFIDLYTVQYGGGNSTNAEEVSRFQRLFPNPSWLV